MEAMQRAWQLIGNPSSLHSDGRKAAELLEQCRDRVARIFACRSKDVVFNSGGSEGDTHALLGAAELINTVRRGLRHYGVCGRPLRIAVSAIEHKAVLHAADKLDACGHKIARIPVTTDALVELDWLEDELSRNGLDLVSVMAVNNEAGSIQPVAELAKLCNSHGVLFHSDAVQVPGHMLTEILRRDDIPLLTSSGHKFGSGRGIGVLVQRQNRIAEVLGSSGEVALPALLCGGQQEHGCRAGTENVAGAAALATALELAESPVEQIEKGDLLTALEKHVLAAFPDAVIHAGRVARSLHISSIAFPGRIGRKLQKELDRRGISVGLGSACSGCDRGVSYVLAAMRVPDELAEATLRISTGWASTSEDAMRFAAALTECLHS